MQEKMMLRLISLFVGGFIGVLFYSFSTLPQYLNISLSALFTVACSYITHVHRDLIEKAPVVWKRTMKSWFGREDIGFVKGLGRAIKEFQYYAVPVLVFCLIVMGGFLAVANLPFFIGEAEFYSILKPESGNELMACLLYFSLVSISFLMVSVSLEEGCLREKCFFVGFNEKREDHKYEIEQGYKEVQLNYRNAFRWFFVRTLFPSIGLFLLALCMLLIRLVQGMTLGFIFMTEYFINLFILVHEKEAVLCGIFALSGLLAGIVFSWNQSFEFADKIILSVVCGVISTAAGEVYFRTVANSIRRICGIQVNGA